MLSKWQYGRTRLQREDVSIRQHTSAYASIRQHTRLEEGEDVFAEGVERELVRESTARSSSGGPLSKLHLRTAAPRERLQQL